MRIERGRDVKIGRDFQCSENVHFNVVGCRIAKTHILYMYEDPGVAFVEILCRLAHYVVRESYV